MYENEFFGKSVDQIERMRKSLTRGLESSCTVDQFARKVLGDFPPFSEH